MRTQDSYSIDINLESGLSEVIEPEEEPVTFRPDVTSILDGTHQRYEYALKLLADAPKIQQGDRLYTTVASRVNVFRRAFGPRAVVITGITHADEYVVRAKAELWIPIGQGVNDMTMVATGHSEEFRVASSVNEWSATENAETSAIGRALAAFGLHGGEFASVNELDGARAAQTSSNDEEATAYLTAEEISKAISALDACEAIDDLAKTWLLLNPALKHACRAAHEAKKRHLNNGRPSGSASEKESSPEAPSRPRSGSGRRRAQSSGAA